MAAASDLASIEAKFEGAGQGHVLKFVKEGKASEEGTAALLKQLDGINVELVNELFTATMAASKAATSGEVAYEPMDKIASTSEAPEGDLQAWSAAGLAAVAAGKVAVLTLAGGQGTRLGFDKPKGQYNLGLPAAKTLFHLQADRIAALKAAAAAAAGVEAGAVNVPWVVMTSPQTHEDTVAGFVEANYYGMGEGGVLFFQQGTLPCLTVEGQIMLQDATTVATAPDGNGGIYRALHESGTYAALEGQGVQYVHVFAVDNALVKVGDPVFLGYCIGAGAEVGAKVCRKTSAGEKVGVLCKRGGKFGVVEYSDMPEATKASEHPDGSLVFSAGNLCIHFYTMAFLGSKASPASLPKVYHIAHKKIPHAHPDTGVTVPKGELTANTGIKLETFIFDVFEAADTVAALEVVRDQEFAPVKNAPGSPSDSPDTARAYILAQGAAWATAHGLALGEGAAVEVSALVQGGVDLAGVTATGPTAVVGAGELPGVVPEGLVWTEAAAGVETATAASGVTFLRVA